jgi:hypothetical protein
MAGGRLPKIPHNGEMGLSDRSVHKNLLEIREDIDFPMEAAESETGELIA